MDHRIPMAGAVAAIVAVFAAVASFLFLNGKFDGPNPLSGVGSQPYELTATFQDSENLPTKQSVLSHGVEVGKVTDVHYDKDTNTGKVTFTVDGEYAPVYKDATARIGERTIIGDPFLDLDRGHAAAGEIPSESDIEALPSVDFDEALSFLDETGRQHLRSILHTVAQGAATEGNGERLNGTVGGLSRTVIQLQRVTSALSGQEDQISSIAQNGATVLGVLGDREASIRDIVGSGRRTLDGLASDTASLQQGVGELPGLLAAGTDSLRDARPLLSEAHPVIRRLRRMAPKLQPAIHDVGPVSGDASAVISGLRPFRIAATPLLGRTHEALVAAKPAIEQLIPAVRNLQPLLAYLAPRSQGFVSFFSNLASATAHGDSNGRWARFELVPVPGELLGGPGGLPSNAYPGPGDANDNQPYVPGSYQRTMPWDPPPRP
jgi:phospholipid/cholesterol/gamma-HCH transport system substrate-binding protein